MNMMYDPREPLHTMRAAFLTLAVTAVFGFTPGLALADVDMDEFLSTETASEQVQEREMPATSGKALYTLKVGETQDFPLIGTADTINVEMADIVELFLPEPEILSVTGLNQGTTTLAIRYDDGSVGMVAILVVDEGELPLVVLMDRLHQSLEGIEGLSMEIDDQKIVITGRTDFRNKNYYKQVVGLFRSEVLSRVEFVKSEPIFVIGKQDDAATAGEELVVVEEDEDAGMYPSMVQVDVKILEVNLGKARNLGTSWFNEPISSTGSYGVKIGSGSNAPGETGGSRISVGGDLLINKIDAKINFLVNKSAGRLLATPKLVVQDGETASFSVGGEAPVVFQTANSVSIDYKKFGTLLDVTPTVLSSNRIGVRVKATLSEIDDSIQSFSVKGYKSKETDTRVNVRTGDTFVLAGLIQQQEVNNNSKVPVLGDIPGISTLFKSKTKSFDTTETMVLMTPHILSNRKDGRFDHNVVPVIGSSSIIDVLNSMDGNPIPDGGNTGLGKFGQSGRYDFDEHADRKIVRKRYRRSRQK